MDQTLYPGSNLTVYQKDELVYLIGIFLNLEDIALSFPNIAPPKRKYPKSLSIQTIVGPMLVLFTKDSYSCLKEYNLEQNQNIIEDAFNKTIMLSVQHNS
jgi:hypothetical protein